MLTTVGRSRSARSANPVEPGSTLAGLVVAGAAAAGGAAGFTAAGGVGAVGAGAAAAAQASAANGSDATASADASRAALKRAGPGREKSAFDMEHSFIDSRADGTGVAPQESHYVANSLRLKEPFCRLSSFSVDRPSSGAALLGRRARSRAQAQRRTGAAVPLPK